jgi:hypothetical protein
MDKKVQRRLRFSFRLAPSMPTTFVDHFSTPGRHSFEAAFAPRGRRYRLSKRILILLFVGFGLGVFAAMQLPVSPAVRLWIVIPSVTLLPLSLLVHFLNLRLRCPSCRKPLAPAKGRYCPQCGSEKYQAGSRRCESCGGGIEEEDADSARSYRIRGCTHCGVFLDQRGI